MKKRIKIASWNIAGGQITDSLEQFDYSKEDVAYFTDQLKSLDADVICIQETHLNTSRSIAKEIAISLGYENVYEVDVSPSHIDKDFRLGNAIISKLPLEHVGDVYYPFPDFELRFKNGNLATTRHDKMIQIYKYGPFMICNTQMLPLEIFGYNYTEEPGKQLASKIEKILIDNLSEPIVFCGDFNFNRPEQVYPTLISGLNLHDVLPKVFTRPALKDRSRSPDHIFVSDQFKCTDSQVFEVNADHYLCCCTLEY